MHHWKLVKSADSTTLHFAKVTFSEITYMGIIPPLPVFVNLKILGCYLQKLKMTKFCIGTFLKIV